MNLTSLSLQHYRNITKESLQFAPRINVFVGKNGQGKTNILEAIFALSLSRPFRSRERAVFVQHDAQFARLVGTVHLAETEQEQLEIFWEHTGSRKDRLIFKRNGIEQKATEFLQKKHFFAVLFAPEDMNLPFWAPQKRRQFLSRILSPLNPEFLEASLRYEKVLKRRNKLLSEFPQRRIEKLEFAFWDAELEKWGQIIQQHRQEFLAFADQHIGSKYEIIAQKSESLQIEYVPSLPADQNFFAVLEAHFAQDVRMGSTQKGPHRDDFRILIRGKELSQIASRGEVRSALIALKLCERDFIAQKTSLNPVLLLDDVFSELDEQRRSALLEVFKSDQVFITTTDREYFFIEKKVQIFEVYNGVVQNTHAY